MTFPKKTNLKVSAVTRNNFDLSSSTVTTNDFGFLKPVFVRNTYPNESFHCKPETFVRTAPLVAPTFGRCRINFDTFFVRYDQVWSSFHHLLDGTKFTESSGTSAYVTEFPYFTMSTVFAALLYTDGLAASGYRKDLKYATLSCSNGNVTVTGQNLSESEIAELKTTPAWRSNSSRSELMGNSFQTALDFQIPLYGIKPLPKGDLVIKIVKDSSSQTPNRIISYTIVFLNAKQKHFLDLFYSLGYGINFTFGELGATGGYLERYPTEDTTKLNAMRLLAFFKVYIDWYESNQFTASSTARTLLEGFLNKGNTSVGPSFLSRFMDCLNVCYEPDLFTSCYTTPQGMPIDSQLVSSTNNPAIPSDPDSSDMSYDNVKGATQSLLNLEVNAISLYVLEKFQRFISRYRVGGQRDIDIYLTEFGVKCKAVDNRRSLLLNHYSQPLQISDVVSTADTSGSDGAQLGAYAGKGVSFGTDSWSLDCNDYGVILTVCTITPIPGYVYGREKETEIMKLTDLYTPDYDGLGMEALSFAQLSTEQGRQYSRDDITPSSVFGYVPRYAHMKVGNDILSGDFRVNTLKEGLDSWHLFRKFNTLSPLPSSSSSRTFVTLQNDERFRKVNGYAGNSQLLTAFFSSGNNEYVFSDDDYDRIFDVTDSREDHFLIFCNWQLHAERSMKSISDIYDLNHPLDGESHRTVTVDYNGKQL